MNQHWLWNFHYEYMDLKIINRFYSIISSEVVRVYFLLVLLFSLVFSLSVQASPVDVAKDSNKAIGKHIQYYQEQGEPLTLANAKSLYVSGNFTQSKKEQLSFGLGAPATWFVINIKNHSTQTINKRLSIETPWLDLIDVYFFQHNNMVANYRVGDSFAFNKRQINSRFFVFDHQYQVGITQVFMRVATSDPFILSVYLNDVETSRQKEISLGYGYGFLYGAIFILMLYNFLLFIGLKRRQYFYYSLYMLSFLAMNIAYTGHGFKWLWSDNIFAQAFYIPLFMMIFVIAGLLFAIHFLDTRKYFPRLYRGMTITCLFAFLLLLFFIFNQNSLAALTLSFAAVLSYSFFMMLIGVISYFAGVRSAKYFLLAIILGMFGAVVTGLTISGIIEYSDLRVLAVEISMMIEASLLALALANRFKLTEQEKNSAEKLAYLDSLTGLNNRRAFYKLSQPIWHNEIDYHQNLSVILLDIDKFKDINDRYGHSVGDKVIVAIADILKASARSVDISARWGGEEFVLLLPETSLEFAVEIAERLRLIIATAIELPVGEKTISVTSSFGVMCRTNNELSLDNLIAGADKQLYRAKSLGRNCVCFEGDNK